MPPERSDSTNESQSALGAGAAAASSRSSVDCRRTRNTENSDHRHRDAQIDRVRRRCWQRQPPSRCYHSTFTPNRTMRGGVIVVGNPNELPDT
jgi:hypothetical protein